jgi:hypothetical protein
MPVLSKPPVKPSWTDGNALKVTEPSSGKKLLGWTKSERPPFQFMNWIHWLTKEWVDYFESVTDDLMARLLIVESNLFSTNLIQEVPTGVADGVNGLFTVSQNPSSPANLFLYKDSLLVPRSEYTIAGRNISFNGGFIPDAGSDIETVYVVQTGFSAPAGLAPGTTPKVETITLSAGDISAEQITLAAVPFDPAQVLVDVINDGPQAYGTDFLVSADVLTWSGLGMTGAVSAGVILRIVYYI